MNHKIFNTSLNAPVTLEFAGYKNMKRKSDNMKVQQSLEEIAKEKSEVRLSDLEARHYAHRQKMDEQHDKKVRAREDHSKRHYTRTLFPMGVAYP